MIRTDLTMYMLRHTPTAFKSGNSNGFQIITPAVGRVRQVNPPAKRAALNLQTTTKRCNVLWHQGRPDNRPQP